MKISGRLTLEDLPRIAPLLCRQTNSFYGEDQTRVVEVRGVRFGGGQVVVIGGPCAVETAEQTLPLAHAVKRAGGDMLRGGAYKPRTSPHDFQGTGAEGLAILRRAREETSLPVVIESPCHCGSQPRHRRPRDGRTRQPRGTRIRLPRLDD